MMALVVQALPRVTVGLMITVPPDVKCSAGDDDQKSG